MTTVHACGIEYAFPAWQKLLIRPRKFPCVDYLAIVQSLFRARFAPLHYSFIN